MIIAVFGATGDTGSLVVQYAIEAGHDVQALIRTPSKLPAVKELSSNLSRIKVTAGDVRDIAAVSLVVSGANAVIECLSMASPGNRPGTIKRDGVAVIVEAMKHLGVKRLIVLSTGGVSPEWQQQMPALLRWTWHFFFNNIDEDAAAAEDVVIAEAGQLQFTILRPPLLLLGVPPVPASSITLSPGPPTPGTNAVPVANVARALLGFATEDVHHNQVVHINCTQPVRAGWSPYRKARRLVWANISRKVLLPAFKVAVGVGVLAIAVVAARRYQDRSRR